MYENLRLLILDDEPIVGKRLGPSLAKMGFEIEIFVDPEAALARLSEQTFDIIVTDIRLGAMNGIEILERVLAKSPRTKVIMISGYATLELARETLAKGAFDFIAKPFKPDELRRVIIKAAKAL